jgi:putative two-component system response regulator
METSDKQQKSILAVDDNPTNLRMLLEILRGAYKVFAAPSGAHALKFLERNLPDLILLDVEMPGMSGYEVIARLKADARLKTVPVIFLTAQEGREEEERALKMGAADYILKPISAGVVIKRVSMNIELEDYRKHLEELVARKTSQIERTQNAILEMLANMTGFRDEETGGHIRRTTAYTALLTEDLKNSKLKRYRLSEDYARDIIICSKLHDIGKVAIPDKILLKPDRLNEEEFQHIKLHPAFGAQMIDRSIRDLGENNSSFLITAREVVLYHHEKWNGKGYPTGLAGEKIPLSARIMSVADVYDALISRRPYKPPMKHEEAVSIIMRDAGVHFDANLLDSCRAALEKFKTVEYDDRDDFRAAHS